MSICVRSLIIVPKPSLAEHLFEKRYQIMQTGEKMNGSRDKNKKNIALEGNIKTVIVLHVLPYVAS